MASQSDALPTQTENIAREGEDAIDKAKDGGEMPGQPCREHAEVEREDECEQLPSWHPIWLRPLTLLSLSLILLVFTVSLPPLLQYSRRNDGLAEARDTVVYLWRFGPTAILTMLTILWSRVEAQALRYMPWIALELGQHAEDGIHDLDYSQMLLPSMLIQSLRRRHFLVFLASIIPIILRVQIVLSPSIFESALIQVPSMTQIEVLDTFSDMDEASTSIRPYYHAKGVQELGMNPPFGLFEHGVYQTFGPLPGHAPATIGASLKAHVDGLFMDMQCIEMKNFTSSLQTQEPLPRSRFLDNITFDLYFEDCMDPVTVSAQGLSPAPTRWSLSTIEAIDTFYKPRLESRRHCSSLPQQQPEFLYFFVYYPRENDYPGKYFPRLLEGGAMICSPTTWVSTVEVVDDGLIRNVTVVPGQSDGRIDFQMNLWESIVDSIPTESGGWDSSSPTVPDHGGPLIAALQFNTHAPDLDDLSLYRSEVLRQAVANLTRDLGPMVFHHGFRQAEDHRTDSSVIHEKNRILVNQAVCVAITVLSGLCICIAVGVLFQLRGLSKIWHREPATMLGHMACFLKNRQLSIPERNDKSMWAACKYTPLVLRSWYRGLFICYGLAVTIALIVSLTKSQDFDGLATVKDESHSFVLWKSVPMLAVLIIALYANSADSAIRALTPFQRLSRRVKNPQELDKSPLDMLGLNAVYHSFRFGMPTVAVSQILVILCAFLGTLSSVLFSSELVPQSTSATYRPQSWLATRNISDDDWDEHNANRYRLKSLYSMQNTSGLSYPRDTYADLVFPVLPMDELPSIDRSTARFTVPAAKLASDCFPLSQGVEFNATLSPGPRNATPGSIEINFNDARDPEVMYLSLNSNSDELPAYFAGSRWDSASMKEQGKTWRAETYSWGRFSASRTDFEEIFVWWCNYSWIEVPTAVTMIETDGDFQIDTTHPPIPDYTKTRPWTPAFDIPLFSLQKQDSDALPEASYPENMLNLNDEFRSLVNVVKSLTLEDLGDPKRDAYVVKVLNDNMSLLMAQLANIESRLALNETSVSEPYDPGELKPIEITLVDNSRRRAVQNANITYVLVSIICLLVLVNTWALISACVSHLLPGSRQHGLLLDLELKGLAPEGFNAMATMASLLHGSNYADHVPHDAFALPPRQLLEHVAGKHFRMGWFFNSQTEERVFTVDILGDDDFDFLESRSTVDDSDYVDLQVTLQRVTRLCSYARFSRVISEHSLLANEIMAAAQS